MPTQADQISTKKQDRSLRVCACVCKALIMAEAICYGNAMEAGDIFHFYRLGWPRGPQMVGNFHVQADDPDVTFNVHKWP